MSSGGDDRDTTRHLQALFAEAGGITGAFTTKVADYTASRPDYPAALFDVLRGRGALFEGAIVADVGSGTGLLARELLRRRYVVIAIEPNAAMRAVADALLSNCPNYCSIAASAEATSLADGSVDLVAAAQAFHWFDVAAVRREWLRILAPNGRVALIWNTRPLDDPLQQAVDDVLGEFGGVRHDALTAQQQLSTVAPFFAGAPYEQFEVPHSQPLERAGFVSLVLSRSTMPDRDTPAGRRAEQVIFSLFDRYVTNAAVTVNYRTVAFLGRPAAAR